MNKELDDKLVKAFPLLYRDRYVSMKDTCMCWGFCGDGWFKLIWDLSKKLEVLIKALPRDEQGNCRAMQVKEKFGTLRFYMEGETPEMTKLIDKAESKSGIICEECGKPGKVIKVQGWLKCRCTKCAKLDRGRGWDKVDLKRVEDDLTAIREYPRRKK